jgi:hypothetical protein
MRLRSRLMVDVLFCSSLVAASLAFALVTEWPSQLTVNTRTRVLGGFPLALAVSAALSFLLLGARLPAVFTRGFVATSGEPLWLLVTARFLAAALPGVLTSVLVRPSRWAALVPCLSLLNLPLWWYAGSWVTAHRGSFARASSEPLLLGAVVTLFQVARVAFPGTTRRSQRLRTAVSLAIPALVAVLLAVTLPAPPE